MIWFFARNGEHLRCEIRPQIEGDRYDLVITLSDGSEEVESYTNSRRLSQRTAELERTLRGQGWDGPFRRDW
jgi:hypothetical protein